MLRTTPSWEDVAAYDGQILAGVDEVGRGCIAGPVVAGAVILPYGLMIEGVNDSKLLSAAKRRTLDRQIRRLALAVGLGWVAAAEVDAQGLSWAVRESGLRALAALERATDLVVLDGNHNYLSNTSHISITLPKADGHVVPVAAASVVAKVARDRYMERLALHQPGYGFEVHKGYGTAAHLAAIAELGPSPLHRRSVKTFRQVAS